MRYYSGNKNLANFQPIRPLIVSSLENSLHGSVSVHLRWPGCFASKVNKHFIHFNSVCVYHKHHAMKHDLFVFNGGQMEVLESACLFSNSCSPSQTRSSFWTDANKPICDAETRSDGTFTQHGHKQTHLITAVASTTHTHS